MQVQVFNQEPKEHVVDKKIGNEYKKIAEQLYPPADIGINEHHKLHQQETNREIDQKRKNKRCHMWFKRIKAQVNHLLMEEECITK